MYRGIMPEICVWSTAIPVAMHHAPTTPRMPVCCLRKLEFWNLYHRCGVSLFALLLLFFKGLYLLAEFHPKVATVGHEICCKTCKLRFFAVPWTNLANGRGELTSRTPSRLCWSNFGRWLVKNGLLVYSEGQWEYVNFEEILTYHHQHWRLHHGTLSLHVSLNSCEQAFCFHSRPRISTKRTFPHVLLNLFRIVSINWDVYTSFRCCLCGRSTRWGESSSKTLLTRTCVGAGFVLSPCVCWRTLVTGTLGAQLLALLLLSWLIGWGWGWGLRVWSGAPQSVKSWS